MNGASEDVIEGSLSSIADALPNGFHDAELSTFAIRWREEIAELAGVAWVAREGPPEVYRPFRLTVEGIRTLTLPAVAPRQERRIVKNWIWQSIRWEFCQSAKNQTKEQHGQERLKQSPSHTYDRLFVSDLDVAPDEENKKFTVCPQLPQTDVEAAARSGDPQRRFVDHGLRSNCGHNV